MMEQFEEIRLGLRPLEAYGQDQVNLAAALQTAALLGCSVEEVKEAVKERYEVCLK